MPLLPKTRTWGSRIALVAGLLLVPAAQAGDFWKKKPPSEWTVDEALELVLDSPWAHEQTVAIPPRRIRKRERSPRNPSQQTRWPPGTWAPAPLPTASYLVRWESAAPVTQAFERLKELGELTSAKFQAPPPRLPKNRYVITVKTTRPPVEGPDLFDRLSTWQLLQGAKLKTSRGPVSPLEVERSGVGASAAVHFFFPRTYDGQPLLREQGEKVEFTFTGRRYKLKCKFTLKPAGNR